VGRRLVSLPNPVSVWTIRLLPPSASGARRARLLVGRLRGAGARASVTPATGSEDVTELDPEDVERAVLRRRGADGVGASWRRQSHVPRVEPGRVTAPARRSPLLDRAARATCAVYCEILERLQPAPWRAVEASAV